MILSISIEILSSLTGAHQPSIITAELVMLAWAGGYALADGRLDRREIAADLICSAAQIAVLALGAC